MKKEVSSDIAVRNEGEVRRAEASPCSPIEFSAPSKCQHCRVSRWYPPMLLASTVLTTVFFWMYITKPVFSPVSPPAPNSTIQGQDQIQADETKLHLVSQSNLDPGTSTLPGDLQSQPMGTDQEEISGDRLRPLIIKRNGPSLFRPFTQEASSGPSAGEADSRIRKSGPVSDKRPEKAEVSGGESGSSDSESSSAERSDSGDLHVHASIMGEFMVSKRQAGANHVIER